MNQEEATAKTFALSPLAPCAKLYSLAEAYAYCRRVTQQSSSNFYYAFRLLPTEQHNALCALYAFCRFMDDIADQPESKVPPGQATSRSEHLTGLLNLWRQELQRCYAGTSLHPISQALADTVRRFPIAQAHLSGIIDGVEMDLHRIRYQTFTELYDYCYHVASLVGLVCIEIFGYHNSCARAYAINLGVAFQLTNILRDVGEDAQRNRIYLPREDLVRFGYGEEELRAGVYNATFTGLMAFEGKRAKEYYHRAVTNLAPEDRRSLAAAEAMRLIYKRLLNKIEAQHFKVFATRMTLPTAAKIGLALAAWGRGWLPF